MSQMSSSKNQSASAKRKPAGPATAELSARDIPPATRDPKKFKAGPTADADEFSRAAMLSRTESTELNKRLAKWEKREAEKQAHEKRRLARLMHEEAKKRVQSAPPEAKAKLKAPKAVKFEEFDEEIYAPPLTLARKKVAVELSVRRPKPIKAPPAAAAAAVEDEETDTPASNPLEFDDEEEGVNDIAVKTPEVVEESSISLEDDTADDFGLISPDLAATNSGSVDSVFKVVMTHVSKCVSEMSSAGHPGMTCPFIDCTQPSRYGKQDANGNIQLAKHLIPTIIGKVAAKIEEMNARSKSAAYTVTTAKNRIDISWK